MMCTVLSPNEHTHKSGNQVFILTNKKRKRRRIEIPEAIFARPRNKKMEFYFFFLSPSPPILIWAKGTKRCNQIWAPRKGDKGNWFFMSSDQFSAMCGNPCSGTPPPFLLLNLIQKDWCNFPPPPPCVSNTDDVAEVEGELSNAGGEGRERVRGAQMTKPPTPYTPLSN